MNNYMFLDKVFLLSIIILSLSGCSGLKAIGPLDYTSKSPKSVVFGTFEQKRAGWQVTGFWIELENIDTKETFLFPFKSEKSFFAIPVHSGKYRITQFYFAKGGSGISLGPNTWSSSDYTDYLIPKSYNYLLSPFQVRQGEALYLGDFYAVSGRGEPKANAFTFIGDITAVKQNFSESSAEFYNSYEKLKNLKTVAAFPQKSNKAM